MGGEHERQVLRDVVQRDQHLTETRGVVDEGRTMEGDQTVGTVEREVGPNRRLHRPHQKLLQAVDHDVSDAKDPARVDALVEQVLVGVG